MVFAWIDVALCPCLLFTPSSASQSYNPRHPLIWIVPCVASISSILFPIFNPHPRTHLLAVPSRRSFVDRQDITSATAAFLNPEPLLDFLRSVCVFIVSIGDPLPRVRNSSLLSSPLSILHSPFFSFDSDTLFQIRQKCLLHPAAVLRE